MLPKKGNQLPKWTGVLSDRKAYAQTLANLLRKEHGDSHRAIKQLMRQTDASERSVKHWLSGQHGPETVYFLRLVVSSPVIKAFALGLIEGPTTDLRATMVDRQSLARTREAYMLGEAAGGKSAKDATRIDPKHAPEHDPINVLDPPDLNERQRWFLTRVVQERCSAQDISATWTVSLKTARRDIAILKAAELICYVGSRRKGRYRRTSH